MGCRQISACAAVVDADSDRVRGYVQAAISCELTHLGSAAEGQRNHALFTTSIAIGQLVGAGVISATDAEQLLIAAAQSHVAAGAYSDGQARKTIASGMRRGINEPRRLPASLAPERVCS